ncbi:hypothetical protein OG762_30245 [Streptomyces sp. NBC_01136]|uniref:hypothetical protein n=1 Tax=Streptomyces sp. NBC_01136 TaxID=2903754 RepID=UPI00386C6A01|nr:hypothetical protein OG762_30245 [Streptomyces sp. NBC_01136]
MYVSSQSRPAAIRRNAVRGTRLARRLTAYCLDSWGHPYDSQVSEKRRAGGC